MSYPYRYELFKRIDESSRKEKYVILATFPHQPTVDEINDAFQGRPRLEIEITFAVEVKSKYVCSQTNNIGYEHA
ncbi:hypothetical protein QJS10_CPA02g01231 [Acorus calamus]|uniref:Uncharacterized protein n=1 Tax=Acorus calamus TaxID=4465 RepID=A0AAV9FF04_ACOCL|nr:hypothetical protein QJS10_CPA02g01231 [Acorus calamus]